jgi:hypothetical protein
LANRLLADRHLADRHLADRHLANRHLANRHLANSHLANRHLVDRHLVDRHLADRHLVNSALKWLDNELTNWLLAIWHGQLNCESDKCHWPKACLSNACWTTACRPNIFWPKGKVLLICGNCAYLRHCLFGSTSFGQRTFGRQTFGQKTFGRPLENELTIWLLAKWQYQLNFESAKCHRPNASLSNACWTNACWTMACQPNSKAWYCSFKVIVLNALLPNIVCLSQWNFEDKACDVYYKISP